MEQVVKVLSTGKALAYDGITDSLFRKEREATTELERKNPPKFLQHHAIKKLRDIWRVELDNFLSEDDTWGLKLVPLNKVYPKIPNRRQMRPIMVQSPIIKLLEARFLKKLKQYSIERMIKAQTGFVPEMGIQVNIERAVRRITLRTDSSIRKQNIYGLFIDFTNAFNTVPHTRLFQKLRDKRVLEEVEIQYLEQLYCRYNIRIGSKKFKANCGVAQGSVISPFLFNIYIEDLALELKEKVDINLEDIFMYADDILTLCSSVAQLKRAISVIENWCENNGMILNKQKSGIVPFAPRSAKRIPLMRLEKKKELRDKSRKGRGIDKEKLFVEHLQWVPAVKEISGVSVCESYKYLGTILTPKLSFIPQVKAIKRKVSYIRIRLYPYLKAASLEARKDMFLTLIMPMFDAALILLKYEPSMSNKEKLIRIQRGIFKDFTQLAKGTKSSLIAEMIGKVILSSAESESQKNYSKWMQRNGISIENEARAEKVVNKLRGVPNTWVDLVNTQFKRCPLCSDQKRTADRWHIKYKHHIDLPNVLRIWRNEIIPISSDVNLTRVEIKERLEPIIEDHLNTFWQMMSNEKDDIRRNKDA